MTFEQQHYQQQYQIPQQQYLDPGVAQAPQGSGLIQKVKEGIHDHQQTCVSFTCPLNSIMFYNQQHPLEIFL